MIAAAATAAAAVAVATRERSKTSSRPRGEGGVSRGCEKRVSQGGEGSDQCVRKKLSHIIYEFFIPKITKNTTKQSKRSLKKKLMDDQS